MTSLSKTISHDYDPSIVYHSHSSNIPHLANWISELVKLTESSYPKNPTPSTEDLVHSLQRYDAVFKELLRQTSIFSEPVTRMLAQAWAGVIKLLDYMIKSYHRYVKHTSHLQTQAHTLLNERQRSEAAHKIQKEEADLERTALRARIRSLESELDSMRIMQAGMEGENQKMRRIISVYIQSSELNEPAWEVMEEDDVAGASDMLRQRGTKKMSSSSQDLAALSQDQQTYGFKRKEVIDAGHQQLKTLNRLDIELNEILANVLKEENRQRLLMQSLLKLIDKNKDKFFSPDELAEAEEDWLGIMAGHRKEKETPVFARMGSTKSLKLSVRPGSSGTTGSAEVGVAASPSSGARMMSAKLPPPFSGGSTKGVTVLGVESDSFKGSSSKETGFSASVSAKQPTMTRLNRSASMMALTTGFAILGSDLDKKCDAGVQVDEKDEFGCVDEEPNETNVEETTALGVAPLPPLSIHIKGAEQPYLIRRRMSTFPKLLRVPPVVWTCTAIMNIYLDKIQTDEERASLGLRKQSMPDHVYDYFLRITGLKSAADVHVAQLLKACESHNRRQPRIALFSAQMGLTSPEEAPPMDIRDTDFILHVLTALIKQGELMPDLFKSLKTRTAVLKSSVLLRPDILRISAVHLVQDTFLKWLPDGGEDFVLKAKAMQSTEKGFRYVDVDNLIDLLLDPWHSVRTNWEDHARFLFREYAGVHRVLQEATFANDEGVECTDTVLVELNKSVATDCLRRPLRLFQRTEDKAGQPEPEGRGGAGGVTATNTNKEPVVEAMSRKQFIECLRLVNPAVTLQEAQDMFQQGLDIAHEDVLRVLEVMWMKFLDDASHYNHITVGGSQSPSSAAAEAAAASARLPPPSPTSGQRHGQQLHGHKHLGTNRDYWVNMRTYISQWTRPYLRRNFRAQDLEMETFVTVLIRNDVLARSPLLENIIHLPPKDLWPNAETFLKQLRDKARRAGANYPSASNATGTMTVSNSQRSSMVFGANDSASSSIRTHLPMMGTTAGSGAEDSESDATSSPGKKIASGSRAMSPPLEAVRKKGAAVKDSSKKVSSKMPSTKK